MANSPDGHDDPPDGGSDGPDVEMVPVPGAAEADDLAGGEDDVPENIRLATTPEVRREVRNAHYNLGHPSTETLLRLMRKAGASDEVQRYARWWKCSLCAERAPPGRLGKTAMPYRPRSFNMTVGVDLKPV